MHISRKVKTLKPSQRRGRCDTAGDRVWAGQLTMCSIGMTSKPVSLFWVGWGGTFYKGVSFPFNVFCIEEMQVSKEKPLKEKNKQQNLPFKVINVV